MKSAVYGLILAGSALSCPPPQPGPPSPTLPTPTAPASSLPSPVPTVSAAFCPVPVWGAGLGATVSIAQRLEREAKINAALVAAGYSHEEVLLGDCGTNSRIFYAALVGKIRERGDCAHNNDDGHKADAVHIVTPDGRKALEHHLINFGGCKVRFASSENYKGDWSLLNPGPSTPPSSPPTTVPPVSVPPGSVPPSSPAPGACPVQHPLHGYHLEVEVGPHGAQQYDATPYLVSAGSPVPPPGWTGVCGTRRCALSLEKDTQHGAACTVDLCGAELLYGLNPPEAGVVNWVRGYTAKITREGPGTLRACCSKVPTACGEVAIP